MAWPPPVLPINRTNADPQQDTHPNDHNTANLAINDSVDQIKNILVVLPDIAAFTMNGLQSWANANIVSWVSHKYLSLNPNLDNGVFPAWYLYEFNCLIGSPTLAPISFDLSVSVNGAAVLLKRFVSTPPQNDYFATVVTTVPVNGPADTVEVWLTNTGAPPISMGVDPLTDRSMLIRIQGQ